MSTLEKWEQTFGNDDEEKIQKIMKNCAEIAIKVKQGALDDADERKLLFEQAQCMINMLDWKKEWCKDCQIVGYQDSVRRVRGRCPVEILAIREYLDMSILKGQERFKSNEKLTKQYLLLYFPVPMNRAQSIILKGVICLSLYLKNHIVLECLAENILKCELILFPRLHLPVNLATMAPNFCAAILTRGFVVGHSSGRKHLAQYMHELMLKKPNEAIDLTKIIRYSFHKKPMDYEVHLAILQMVKQGCCQKLKKQLLLALATHINKSEQKPNLKDRLIQLLTVVQRSKMCEISNVLKKSIADKGLDHYPAFKAFNYLHNYIYNYDLALPN